VYDVEVAVNQSVQPFDVEVTVGNVPDLELTTNGDSGASTFDPLTGELNIPNYTLDGLGGVPESRTLTINGTTQDLSANRTFNISAGTPVTIGSPANGLSIDPTSQVLSLGLASSGMTGALSSTDWSTFNGKQSALGFTPEDIANKSTDSALGTSSTLYPSQGAVKSYVDTGLSGKQNTLGYTPENVANKAINLTSPDDTKYPTTLAVSTALAGKQNTLTNPVTGTGTSGQVAFWTGTGTQSGDSGLVWDNVNKRLGIGANAPLALIDFRLSNNSLYSASTAGLNNIFLNNQALNNTFNSIAIGARGSDNELGYIVLNAISNGVYRSADFSLQTRHNGVYGERIRVFSAGNIGINTTTDAGFRLDVNGTARVQGNLTTNLTAGRVPFIGTGGVLSDTVNFTYDSVNGILGVNNRITFINGLGDYVGSSTSPNIYRSLASGVFPFSQAGSLILQSRTRDFEGIFFVTGLTPSWKWQIKGTGELASNEGANIELGTTTGTKIGTATSQKLALWNATPIVQPTTSVASATRVGGGGTTLTDTDTFDGYTLAQIVKALRNMGALA